METGSVSSGFSWIFNLSFPLDPEDPAMLLDMPSLTDQNGANTVCLLGLNCV